MANEIDLKKAFAEVYANKDKIKAIMLDDEYIQVDSEVAFDSEEISKDNAPFDAFVDYKHFFDILKFIEDNSEEIKIVEFIDDTIVCEFKNEVLDKLITFEYVTYEVFRAKKTYLNIVFKNNWSFGDRFIKNRSILLL